MSRVENMFGPRESWGQGDEKKAVRERAVRKQGDGSLKAEKKNAGGGHRAAPVKRRGEKAPSVSRADSSPIPAGQGSLGNGAKKPVKGFVHIRCGGCGKVVSTCLHEERESMICKNCQHHTPLKGLTTLHMRCARCGFTGKYRTNRTEEKIQMECLNCSDIVYLTRIRRGNYVPEVEA